MPVEQLTVYIDRLNKGDSQTFDEKLDPGAFFALDDEDLKLGPCTVKGSAYLGGDYLVVQLSAQFDMQMPCNICGEKTGHKLELKNVYLTKDLDEIKKSEYPFTEDLRETLLLEVPPYLECSGGKCPKREEMSAFLKKNETSEDNNEVYYPFKDL